MWRGTSKPLELEKEFEKRVQSLENNVDVLTDRLKTVEKVFIFIDVDSINKEIGHFQQSSPTSSKQLVLLSGQGHAHVCCHCNSCSHERIDNTNVTQDNPTTACSQCGMQEVQSPDLKECITRNPISQVLDFDIFNDD